MNTFKNFLDEELELDKEIDELDEVLSIQTRMKMKQSMRKNKSKIAMGRRRASRKVADTGRLKKRAQRQARKAIMNKILKGKNKSELSYGARSALEKRVNKRASVIKRMAKKLLPTVRSQDRQKMKAK